MYDLKDKQVLVTGPGNWSRAAWSLFTPCTAMGSLLEADNLAAPNVVPGDVVFPSPVCSSFDQFRNYQHRGDVFRQAVTQGGDVNNISLRTETNQRDNVENNFLFCFGFFEEKPRRKSTTINQPPQRKDAYQRQRQ